MAAGDLDDVAGDRDRGGEAALGRDPAVQCGRTADLPALLHPVVRPAVPGQQHSTFNRESEHFRCSWDESKRIAMRNITGHAGGAKRFGAEYRILQFGFVQFR